MTDLLNLPDTLRMSDMRRNWWIAYKWITTQEVGEVDPVYIKAGLRPIEESIIAGEQFDAARNAYQSTRESE